MMLNQAIEDMIDKQIKNMLGTEIKELRSKKGISQQKLADKTGVAIAAIKNIELNKADPRFSTVKKILSELLPVFPNGRKDYRSMHKYFE